MPAAELDLADRLARLGLFDGVSREQLERVAATAREDVHPEGAWIIREGDDGHPLYIILEGEAAAVIDDEERGRLTRGSFFGEMSILLGEPATADVVTRTPLRALAVPRDEVERFLLDNPSVTFQMLRTEARRLQAANRWRN